MSNQEMVVAEVRQEKAPEQAELTWGEVTEKFFEYLKTSGKEGQSRNFKTAISFFLAAIGLTNESPVGIEITEEFEAKIELYVQFQEARGLGESTYGPRISKIKTLKIFVEQNFKQRLHIQALPKSFGKKLRGLIIALGLTIKGFWRTLPEGLLSYKTFAEWCKEKRLPTVKFYKVISTIEHHLGIPAGTLRVPKYYLKGHGLKVGHSDAGNKTRAALSKPYYAWTESLEEEFKGLFKNKTLAILPEDEERSEEGQWTLNQGGDFPSAKATKNILKSFVGFCSLAEDSPDPYLRGAGIKLENLSLALLADKKLVERYRDFMKLRSGLRVKPLKNSSKENLPAHMISPDGRWEYYDKGGKYNRGTLRVLSVIISLLQPGSGYLLQHPELSQKLAAPPTVPEWKKQCRATLKRVKQLHKSISKMQKRKDSENFDFGRDPKEVIQWILDLPRPLFILQEMIKAMLDDLLPESAPVEERATQYRDLVLAALLCANPLRIIMFSYMKFGENLIRHSDGSWWLKFSRQAFKNRKALDSDYDVRVAEELWPLLDRYKDEFHPILAQSTGSTYVFIRRKRGIHAEHVGAALNEKSLSNIIQELTELYISGAIGFRPHAFRHIVATDIIKKNPRLGFFIAAKALNDKLETVEKEYVHLKTSEFFEPVNLHFQEAWQNVFNSKQIDVRSNNVKALE